jgi:hypothetical protein
MTGLWERLTGILAVLVCVYLFVDLVRTYNRHPVQARTARTNRTIPPIWKRKVLATPAMVLILTTVILGPLISAALLLTLGEASGLSLKGRYSLLAFLALAWLLAKGYVRLYKWADPND